MPTPRQVHRATTRAFAVSMVVIGIVLLVESIALGGVLGILLGALFAAAGAARLYLLTRTR